MTDERRIDIGVSPMTVEAFAPYGRLLVPASRPTTRAFTDAGLECDGRPTLNVIWQPPQGRRFTCLERHSDVTQGFVHLGGGRAVVCVAARTAADPDAIPDPDSVCGFLLEPGMAWLFHRQTWHSLDRYVIGELACTFLILNTDPNPTQILDYRTGQSQLHTDLGNDRHPRLHQHIGRFGIEFEIDDARCATRG